MRSERGQATVEWIGLLLLVALALAALSRLAPHADGRPLATALAHSITRPETDRTAGKPGDSPLPGSRAFVAPPLVPHPAPVGPRSVPRIPRSGALTRWARRAGGRELAARVRRGAGSAWRRAWYACLVYERLRWALLHPESRFPGYTMPPTEVLRIANDCLSPVDLVRDWSMLQRGAP